MMKAGLEQNKTTSLLNAGLYKPMTKEDLDLIPQTTQTPPKYTQGEDSSQQILTNSQEVNPPQTTPTQWDNYFVESYINTISKKAPKKAEFIQKLYEQSKQPYLDIDSALKEGYTPDEIVSYIKKTKKYDIDSALKEGYTPDEIVSYLKQEAKQVKYAKRAIRLIAENKGVPADDFVAGLEYAWNGLKVTTSDLFYLLGGDPDNERHKELVDKLQTFNQILYQSREDPSFLSSFTAGSMAIDMATIPLSVQTKAGIFALNSALAYINARATSDVEDSLTAGALGGTLGIAAAKLVENPKLVKKLFTQIRRPWDDLMGNLNPASAHKVIEFYADQFNVPVEKVYENYIKNFSKYVEDSTQTPPPATFEQAKKNYLDIDWGGLLESLFDLSGKHSASELINYGKTNPEVIIQWLKRKEGLVNTVKDITEIEPKASTSITKTTNIGAKRIYTPQNITEVANRAIASIRLADSNLNDLQNYYLRVIHTNDRYTIPRFEELYQELPSRWQNELRNFIGSELSTYDMIDLYKRFTIASESIQDKLVVSKVRDTLTTIRNLLKDRLPPEEYTVVEKTLQDYSNARRFIKSKLGNILASLDNGRITEDSALKSLRTLNESYSFRDLAQLIGMPSTQKFEKLVIKSFFEDTPIEDIRWDYILRNLQNKEFVSIEGQNLQKMIEDFNKVFSVDNFMASLRLGNVSLDRGGLSADLFERFKVFVASRIFLYLISKMRLTGTKGAKYLMERKAISVLGKASNRKVRREEIVDFWRKLNEQQRSIFTQEAITAVQRDLDRLASSTTTQTPQMPSNPSEVVIPRDVEAQTRASELLDNVRVNPQIPDTTFSLIDVLAALNRHSANELKQQVDSLRKEVSKELDLTPTSFRQDRELSPENVAEYNFLANYYRLPEDKRKTIWQIAQKSNQPYTTAWTLLKLNNTDVVNAFNASKRVNRVIIDPNELARVIEDSALNSNLLADFARYVIDIAQNPRNLYQRAVRRYINTNKRSAQLREGKTQITDENGNIIKYGGVGHWFRYANPIVDDFIREYSHIYTELQTPEVQESLRQMVLNSLRHREQFYFLEHGTPENWDWENFIVNNGGTYFKLGRGSVDRFKQAQRSHRYNRQYRHVKQGVFKLRLLPVLSLKTYNPLTTLTKAITILKEGEAPNGTTIPELSKELQDLLAERGYDGIIFNAKRYEHGTSVLIFNPNLPNLGQGLR